jgi:hypothetical protein
MPDFDLGEMNIYKGALVFLKKMLLRLGWSVT